MGDFNNDSCVSIQPISSQAPNFIAPTIVNPFVVGAKLLRREDCVPMKVLRMGQEHNTRCPQVDEELAQHLFPNQKNQSTPVRLQNNVQNQSISFRMPLDVFGALPRVS